MGMGMGGLGGGSGLMSWIYSINYFITSVGHMASVVGMNSHALLAAYKNAYNTIQEVIARIRTSELRRVLQRKCKRSALLRFLFVAGCSTLCGAALKVIHSYWGYCETRRLGHALEGGAGSVVPGYSGYVGAGYGAGAGAGARGVGGAFGAGAPPPTRYR